MAQVICRLVKLPQIDKKQIRRSIFEDLQRMLTMWYLVADLESVLVLVVLTMERTCEHNFFRDPHTQPHEMHFVPEIENVLFIDPIFYYTLEN